LGQQRAAVAALCLFTHSHNRVNHSIGDTISRGDSPILISRKIFYASNQT
jgi:hypothetical protein